MSPRSTKIKLGALKHCKTQVSELVALSEEHEKMCLGDIAEIAYTTALLLLFKRKVHTLQHFLRDNCKSAVVYANLATLPASFLGESAHSTAFLLLGALSL